LPFATACALLPLIVSTLRVHVPRALSSGVVDNRGIAMRKISFAAILISALAAGALPAAPAQAVSNNPTGGGGNQNQGGYCLGTLRECLAGCRGLAPQQYVWCHTNCILLNQDCLGYPLARHQPIGARPITSRPIGSKPIYGKPIYSKPTQGKPIYGKPVQAPPSNSGTTVLERGSGSGGHGRH
jgi:hypothetical protein